MELHRLIDRLELDHRLTEEEYALLIDGRNQELADYLFEKADRVRRRFYGTDVYIRGLIEFSNYCKNDCLYCGIRHSNQKVGRYRLSPEEILDCCDRGYELGFRTFVLQSGEDPWYTPQRLADIISRIKQAHPDCAVTLSAGEQDRDVYQMWFTAGADRYLLRHETADDDHYHSLHPKGMSPQHRKECLWNLKEIGYQVGCGFMVGSPGQTPVHLAKDMMFLQELEPDMVGIGPFIPHHDTPFRGQAPGTLEQTLFMLGLVRLALPDVLLPATTALGTIHPQGREKGILAGANVCMPNLSPEAVRDKYTLYDNKNHTGSEDAASLCRLRRRMEQIGYRVVVHRGDHIRKRNGGQEAG